MRISGWSADVRSTDLIRGPRRAGKGKGVRWGMRPMRPGPGDPSMAIVLSFDTAADKWSVPIGSHSRGELSLQLERLMAGRLLIQGSSGAEIGRAPCGERVCQSV